MLGHEGSGNCADGCRSPTGPVPTCSLHPLHRCIDVHLARDVIVTHLGENYPLLVSPFAILPHPF